MNTRQSLKTQMKIGPHVLLISALLRASATDLEQLITRELADNPALELPNGETSPGSLYARTSPASGSTSSSPHQLTIDHSWATEEFEDGIENIAADPSVISRLTAQVVLLVEQKDLDVVISLLHTLDGHGYLRTPPEELANELGVDCASLERLIRVVHELEPPGIGARDLCECFLLQCVHLESQGIDCGLTRRILSEAWHDFIRQRWDRVAQRLHVPACLVEKAWRFIYHNLYPYPLSILTDSQPRIESYGRADLRIHAEIIGGCPVYSIEIPSVEQYDLHVGPYFEEALQTEDANGQSLSGPERAWIHTYVGRARQFISALHQRWSTLRRISEYLIAYQSDFLEHGFLHLKPLTRATVAAELGYHESTISRAIQDKFVQLPNFRLMPLSDFFDNSLVAKEVIRQIMACSSQPLSDQELAERLSAEGYKLARRTVAKYREQIQIPNSHRRRCVGFSKVARTP